MTSPGILFRKRMYLGPKILGVALVGALAILLPLYPTWIKFPNRDSGVFLYVGWRMLQGEVPYRDVWEHKPPLVFFVDALGLGLGGGRWVGVWGVEVVWLTITLYIFYRLLVRMFGAKPGILAFLLMLSTLVCTIHGGNLTPEYALLFQVSTLGLLYRYGKTRDIPVGILFAIGVLGGMAFLTKQTIIGLWLGLGAALTWRYGSRRLWRAWWKAIIALGLGALMPIMAVSLYFEGHSALGAFWREAFLYNFAYIGQRPGWAGRVKALLFGGALLSCSGLLPIALIGLWQTRARWGTLLVREKSLLWAILLALPVEGILVALSGKYYTHYYTPLLPELSVLAGLAFKFVWDSKSRGSIAKRSWTVATLLGALIPWIFLGLGFIPRGYATQERMETLEYLQTRLQPEDTVLFWGAEAGANFLLKAPAPTRYVYLYPLYTPGYADEETILAFLDALLKRPPRYIIDTQNPSTPFLQFAKTSLQIRETCTEIRRHLKPEHQVSEWTIYRWEP